MRRSLIGSTAGISLAILFGIGMVPLRPHLSVATAALVFFIPVVIGVTVGGLRAGVASVVAGFLVYDYGFIPPYNRLTVDRPQNWVTLAVYAAVMLLVVRLAANLEDARSAAQRRSDENRRLFELSELLVEDRSVGDLLKTIARVVGSVFGVPGVTLLVPQGDRLEIAASAGEPLSQTELQRLEPLSGIPVSLGSGPGVAGEIRTVALTTSGRPIGMLAMRGIPASEEERALLRTFANHAALALERAQLRERALRSEVLEEIDRLRHALMGAVSHDLRTPLATMKVASSMLYDPTIVLSEADVHELHGLIDVETDRLNRLVTSLLDMTRIDAGVLEVRRAHRSVLDLVTDTVASLRSALTDGQVDIEIPDDLPEVDIDHILIGQVLANLLDNAIRHAPPNSTITVAGTTRNGHIEVSVMDRGPGVPLEEQEAVFDRFVRFDTGGRAGLGLTIAKTFVEAHGGQIWVEDAPEAGARFVFTLSPAAANGIGG